MVGRNSGAAAIAAAAVAVFLMNSRREAGTAELLTEFFMF
jgi:hypothetical protein